MPTPGPQTPLASASSSSPSADIESLLNNLLSAFGKKPKAEKGQKAKSKSLPRNAKPLTLAESFAFEKTGYTTWTAKAKIIILEEQTCSCCGSRVTAVKDELYLLDHKTSHSAWFRHEGYGIVEPENLPIRFHRAEPRFVSCCATCASAAIDDVLTLLSSPQLSLSL